MAPQHLPVAFAFRIKSTARTVKGRIFCRLNYQVTGSPDGSHQGSEKFGVWSLERAMATVVSKERIDDSAMQLLHRACQRADELFGSFTEGFDLTPRQFAVLQSVQQHENINQMGIVADTGIDRSTLAELAARLVQKGLLSRRRTPQDARSYAVRLTPEGQAVLKAASEKVASVNRELLAALPVEQRPLFMAMLSHLVRQSNPLHG